MLVPTYWGKRKHELWRPMVLIFGHLNEFFVNRHLSCCLNHLTNFGSRNGILSLKQVWWIDFLSLLKWRWLVKTLRSEWWTMLSVHEWTWNVMRRLINRLMVFIRLVLMALMSFFLMLLLNSNNFFFHLSDLLLQLILLPNLPFDLLSILIFEQLLSSGKSLFLDLKPLLELFLVHNVVVGLLLINLVFLNICKRSPEITQIVGSMLKI